MTLAHVRHAPASTYPPLFFFSGLRRPPSSTLFPYTTLFRPRPHRPRGLRRDQRGQRRPRVAVARAPRVRAGDRDRKSTRLNSSHRTISYAVFCLKKKKAAITGSIFVLGDEYLIGLYAMRGDP